MINVVHIERNEDVRELVSFGLDQDGEFHLRQYKSLDEAIEECSEDFRPDLVVTAYTQFITPSCNAPARACHQAWEDAKVIYLTAEARPGIHEILMDHGVVDIITKPFDPMDLPQRLKSFFQEKRSN